MGLLVLRMESLHVARFGSCKASLDGEMIMKFDIKTVNNIISNTDIFNVYEESDTHLAIDGTYWGDPYNIKIAKNDSGYHPYVRFFGKESRKDEFEPNDYKDVNETLEMCFDYLQDIHEREYKEDNELYNQARADREAMGETALDYLKDDLD